jgi:hypothetical protein
MRTDALRAVIERDRKLRKILAKKKKVIPNGKTYREVATGKKVCYCPVCGAPVMDSAEGRAGHAQRSAHCAEGIAGGKEYRVR